MIKYRHPRVSGGKKHMVAVYGSEILGQVGTDSDGVALRYSKLKQADPGDRGQ